MTRSARARSHRAAMFFVLAASAAGAQVPELDFENVEVEGMLGLPVQAELTRIEVPLDHFDDREHRTIELAAARIATDHPEPGSPIYFLAGGPGGSGVHGAAGTATHPQIRLLEHADIIGLDQRGTGRSRPSLTDGPDENFARFAPPPDQPMTRDSYLTLLRRVFRSYREQIAKQGFELNAFNTAQSVEDIEALRRAMGHERIVLYGASYGTHLGLAYLRRYPEHVERAVFLHVEGPDHTWKLPSAAQTVLEQVSAQEARWHTDDRASLMDRLRSTLVSLETQPLIVEEAHDPGTAWAIGAFEVRAEIAARLGSVREIETLPTLVDALERGDASAFVDMARELRRPFGHPLLVAMDCASGGSSGRRSRIDRERIDPDYLLREAILLPVLPEACDVLSGIDLGDTFREPFESEVPMLLVSGDLDGRTPPPNVHQLLAGFSNVTHVLVENASHDSRQLMAREFRAILQGFLRGDSFPRATTLRLPPPLFERTATADR